MPADPLPTVNGRPGNREVPGVWRRGRPRPSLEASDTQAEIRGPRLAFPPSAGHADAGLMVDAERLSIRRVVDNRRLIPEALGRSEDVGFTPPLLSMP